MLADIFIRLGIHPLGSDFNTLCLSHLHGLCCRWRGSYRRGFLVVQFSSRGENSNLKMQTIATTDHGSDAFFAASLAVRSEVGSDSDGRGHETMKYDFVLLGGNSVL